MRRPVTSALPAPSLAACPGHVSYLPQASVSQTVPASVPTGSLNDVDCTESAVSLQAPLPRMASRSGASSTW